VYFPDDAHWNTAGHEIASRVLGDFLRAHASVPKQRFQ
jgi:hypothetical protein